MKLRKGIKERKNYELKKKESNKKEQWNNEKSKE